MKITCLKQRCLFTTAHYLLSFRLKATSVNPVSVQQSNTQNRDLSLDKKNHHHTHVVRLTVEDRHLLGLLLFTDSCGRVYCAKTDLKAQLKGANEMGAVSQSLIVKHEGNN